MDYGNVHILIITSRAPKQSIVMPGYLLPNSSVFSSRVNVSSCQIGHSQSHGINKHYIQTTDWVHPQILPVSQNTVWLTTSIIFTCS